MWSLFHSSWSLLGFWDMLINVFHKIWDIFSNICASFISFWDYHLCMLVHFIDLRLCLDFFFKRELNLSPIIFSSFFPSPPFFLSTYLTACLIFFLYSLLLSILPWDWLNSVGLLSSSVIIFSVNWNLLLYPPNEFCILVSVLFNFRISVWFFLKTSVYLYFLFSETFFWYFPLYMVSFSSLDIFKMANLNFLSSWSNISTSSETFSIDFFLTMYKTYFLLCISHNVLFQKQDVLNNTVWQPWKSDYSPPQSLLLLLCVIVIYLLSDFPGLICEVTFFFILWPLIFLS